MTDIMAADEAALMLKNLGYADEVVQRFHAAAVAGDTEALARQWYVRELRPLVNGELRATYFSGLFPDAPQLRSPGGKVIDGQQLLTTATERAELRAKYGAENAEAASPSLREPII